jgi:hypothetical protein
MPPPLKNSDIPTFKVTGIPSIILTAQPSTAKSSPYDRPRRHRGVEVQFYSFVTSALEGSGWSAPRPGRFTPGKDPVPTVQEAGWATEPVWTGAKNLASTGIRYPYRPARS